MAVSPFWLIVAIAALIAAWRIKALGRLGRGALILVAIVALLVGFDVFHLPSITELVTQIGERLGKWTYLLVGVNAFLETGAFLGFIAPGETMVLFGGVLAGEGTIELVPLILITWSCAMLGDLTSYVIGRRSGRDFLLRHGAKVKIGESQVAFVESFFTKHGDLTILLGRWVGVVRPLVPFLAGSSKLNFWRFLAVDLVATLTWSAALCVLGSIFWQNFEDLTSLVGRFLLIFGSIVALAVALAVALNARRSQRRSAAVERWLARMREERFAVGRPATALWALLSKIEPRLPGGQGRREATAPVGTVPNDAESGPAPGSAETPSDER